MRLLITVFRIWLQIISWRILSLLFYLSVSRFRVISKIEIICILTTITNNFDREKRKCLKFFTMKNSEVWETWSDSVIRTESWLCCRNNEAWETWSDFIIETESWWYYENNDLDEIFGMSSQKKSCSEW